MLRWVVLFGLLAVQALLPTAGQRRFSWANMSAGVVAPWWGVNTGGCMLGWSEVSHLCS